MTSRTVLRRRVLRLREKLMRATRAAARPGSGSGSTMPGRVMVLSLVTMAACLSPRNAYACPVCFGVTDTPMLRGSSMGILALLVVTAAMLGTFGWFFRTLARRERESATLVIPPTADARRSEIQA